jgi:predicted CXXCH cytochrome family protein
MRRFLTLGLTLCLASSAGADSIVGSAHDLSSAISDRICVWCHTPHFANENLPDAPLWNRFVSNEAFTLYGSPTMDTTLSAPAGVSLLCLGCHDGVNADGTAHGFVGSTKHVVIVHEGLPDTTSFVDCEGCHSEIYSGRPSKLRLGTDLSDDHPVGMAYPTPQQDPRFFPPPDPSDGWDSTGDSDVKLFAGRVECASCHNVHDPGFAPFLVKPNLNSELCLTCHDK